MDGGNWDVDGAWRVVIGDPRGPGDGEVILILAEDVRAEDGQVDVVYGDLPHLRQVDGHLSGLQVEQTGLVDDCTKICGQEGGKPHNLKLGSPNIGSDLSKIIMLCDVVQGELSPSETRGANGGLPDR